MSISISAFTVLVCLLASPNPVLAQTSTAAEPAQAENFSQSFARVNADLEGAVRELKPDARTFDAVRGIVEMFEARYGEVTRRHFVASWTSPAWSDAERASTATEDQRLQTRLSDVSAYANMLWSVRFETWSGDDPTVDRDERPKLRAIRDDLVGFARDAVDDVLVGHRREQLQTKLDRLHDAIDDLEKTASAVVAVQDLKDAYYKLERNVRVLSR